MYGRQEAPKPPNYKDQNNALIQDAQQGNLDIAADWNADVSAFNKTLLGDNWMKNGQGGLYGQFNDWTKQFGNLSYKNFWDDPTTTANENLYKRLYGTGTALRNALTGLQNQYAQGPQFTTLVQGPTGGLTIGDLPDVYEARSDIYGNISSGLDTYLKKLDDMLAERKAEEKRIADWKSGLKSRLTGYEAGLGQLGIEDELQLNQLKTDLALMGSDVRGFSSPILKQLGGLDPALQARLKALNKGVGSLSNQRRKELERIANYEASLRNKSKSWYDKLKGATIKDENLLKGLDKELEEAMFGVGRFESVLDEDLSQERDEMLGVGLKIDQLMRERQTELDRIKAAETQFGTRAQDLESLLNEISKYNGAQLGDYDQRLATLRSEMAGFQSPLGASFASLDPRLAEIDRLLQEKKGAFATAIDPFDDRIAAAGSGLGSMELWDTEARKKALDELLDVQSELSPYTGGEVSDLRTQLEGYLKTIEDQNKNLGTRQDELTDQAEAMLKAIQEGSYFDKGTVSSKQTEAQALADMIKQYGAVSGEDEMETIDSFLKGQTNRLEQDAANLEARRLKGEQAILGSDNIENLRQSGYLDDDQIMQLLQLLQQQRVRQPATAAPGAFSGMLGM